MKIASIATILFGSAAAFTATTPFHHKTSTVSNTFLKAVELTPEPEGGEELTKVSETSLPGSRMKNMGLVEEDNPDGDIYNFWLTAVANGDEIKKLRIQTEKEASKKANFPGFRKGQIPPYAQPKMTMFAIQEAVIKTCEASLEAYGLQSLQGSQGEVKVNEDMQEVCKGYKLGNDIPFTATYKGKFDEAVQAASEEGHDTAAMEDVVVDVEAVAE
mmetsp:Transcript_899/g.1982  ORF Transcript_899/g.1982 Transcript_899/m.1982 type:complete len:216 (-) Transcript_899:83-730(-)